MQLPQAGQPKDHLPKPNGLPGLPKPPEGAGVREKIIHAIQQVYDPEIPVNIYELGLIYDIKISEDNKNVVIHMTLTTPNCPEAQTLPQMVKSVVETMVDEVDECAVNIVWEPLWHRDMMSDEAKLQLGLI